MDICDTDDMPTKPVDLIGWRFWSKVDFTPTCWKWTAFRNPEGYGMFGIGSRRDGSRRVMLAHRWAYEFCIEPIPEGMTIDHLCRVRNCVHPDHLRVVTHEANRLQADWSNNGAWQRAKTHCKRGHPFNQANTRRNAKGHRTCKACDALLAREYRARLKGHDISSRY